MFVFTLYDPHTHQEYLKVSAVYLSFCTVHEVVTVHINSLLHGCQFGAPSAEEAGRWVTAFKRVANQVISYSIVDAQLSLEC